MIPSKSCYFKQTFLNTSVQNDVNRIKINGYNLIRSDHPSDPKKGGVCIYSKEHIPLIKHDDIFGNCLLTEICFQNEKCFVNCIYHNEFNSDEFQNLCVNFHTLLNDVNNEFPICSVVTGNFNSCS